MARFNEINVGRYNRFLTRLFQMKGASAAPQLASEIQPSFQLFAGIENRVLENWDRFSNAFNQAATPAVFSTLRFRNPAGSNVIAVFEKLAWFAQTAGALQVNLERSNVTTVDLGAIATSALHRMDPRGRDSYTIVLSSGTSATGAGIGVVHGSSAVSGIDVMEEMILYENQEIPLLPGDTIQLIAQTANISLGVHAIWRERSLEESER